MTPLEIGPVVHLTASPIPPRSVPEAVVRDHRGRNSNRSTPSERRHPLGVLHGASVIGTASINMGLLRELDLEEEIDYSQTPFETVVDDVDVVLDTVGGDTQERSWSLLRPGGILLSTIQPHSEETAESHGVRQGMIATSPPIGPTLTEVARLVDSGEIKPVVSLILPLEDIQKAHTLIEGRHTRGKIVLQVMP